MSSQPPSSITIHKFGEQAILVNFEQQIQEGINQQVLQLNTAIQKANLSAITFTIPAYCSLTVGYDPALIDDETLRLLILNLMETKTDAITQNETRQLSVPVCYDAAFALDLASLAKEKAMTSETIIQSHTAQAYKVYMLGFLPGFTFMGKLPPSLACKRKKKPRLKVPALSVGLAGEQTGIYPSEVPGGWQIIGRTPLPIFDAAKKHPFLFQAGDQVQFYPISKKEFATIQKDITTNTFNWQLVYG